MLFATASALLLAALNEIEAFALPNGLLFDLAATASPTQDAAVVVVRSAAATEPLLQAALRTSGAAVERVEGAGTSSIEALAPRLGVSRRVQLRGMGERLINLPPTTVMPVLRSEQLLNGSVPLTNLRGVLVLAAPPLVSDPPRFTPSALGKAPEITGADLLARAHHAKATGQLTTEVRGLVGALLLMAVALVLSVGLRLSRVRHVTGATLLIAAAMPVLGLALVRWANLLVPVTELAILSSVVGMATLARRKVAREARLSTLTERASSFAARFTLLSDQRRWVDFFPAAIRLTGVRSGLLLEEQRDGNFVVRAAASAGSGEEVPLLERTEAFDEADRVRPEPARAGDLAGWSDAWISRLDKGAELPLYWVFRLGADDGGPALEAARRLAVRVSQLPLLRTAGRRRTSREDVDAQLFASLGAMLSRSSELQRSLGALQTATMLFDGAGIPLQVNDAMERLLRLIKKDPSRVTPVDLASALGGADADTARGMLSELLRHGGDLNLQSQAEVGGRRFGVRVTEIGGDLLFEATDVTDLHRLAELQRELAADIDARMRNDLEAIELASRLASDERLRPSQRSRALSMVGEAASRSRVTLENVARLVDASIYSRSRVPYPLNPRSALVQAAGALKKVAEQRGVKIELRQPALAALVLAEPSFLDGLIRAMLLVPLSDSQRGESITASLSEGQQFTQLVVTGGFGLPADRFAQAVAGEGPERAEPLQLLGDARIVVEAWGADVQASSEAGQGYRLVLRLRKDER